jgi:hypothetical protein
LDETRLEEPGARVPVEVMNALVVRGRARTGEPGIENIELGEERDVVLLSMLIALMRIGHTLTGRELTGQAYVAMPRPAYYDRFAGGDCRTYAFPMNFTERI